jgi:YD repeat-containing protein
MQNQTISFTAPNPYQADLAKIQEQRQLAQLLQQQSMQAPERFSYKGIEARTSPLTGLAKALQGFAAEKMRIDARNEEKALGERYRADRSSDLQTLVEALGAREGRAAQPTEYPSSGTAGGGEAMGLPAVTAKPAGVLDPSVLSAGVFKTPDIENMAVQQYLSQLAPKAPIKVNAGETLLHPTTFAEVYKAPDKAEYSQPVRERLPDGTIVTVAYDKSGNRKVIETGGAQPAVSVDTEARLAQERQLADRAFHSLSAAQQEQARQEAERLGISLADYNLRKYQVYNPALHIVQSGENYAGVDPRTGQAIPITMQGTAGVGAQTPLAGPAKPPTEDQAKAAGFANRMLQANSVIEKLNFQPTRIGNIASAIPGSNFLLPSERQQAEQAQRNFINAILRRESGAAIAPSEFESAAKQYFPQPGDKPEVLEQKRQNRALAIQGLQQGAGTSYKPYVPPTTGVKFLGFE